MTRRVSCGERSGTEDICSLPKGHPDQWHQDEANRSRWLRSDCYGVAAPPVDPPRCPSCGSGMVRHNAGCDWSKPVAPPSCGAITSRALADYLGKGFVELRCDLSEGHDGPHNDYKHLFQWDVGAVADELADCPMPGELAENEREGFAALERVVRRHASYDHDCQTTICQAMFIWNSQEFHDLRLDAYQRGGKDLAAAHMQWKREHSL